MKRAFSKANKWITCVTVLAVTILFIGGCVPANQPPVITSLQAEREIVPNLGSCQVECVASDPEGVSETMRGKLAEAISQGKAP